MAKFRCCGNYNTDGHAEGCLLKPPTTTQMREPPPKPDDEEGCQFDILHFEHIGKCRGTCGEQGKAIQFTDESKGTKRIIIIIVDSDLDEETLKEMEERGLHRLSEEEMHDILLDEEEGETIQIVTMTLEELREKYPRRNSLPKKDPNPYLSIKDAAQELQFSESWVRKLCAKGRLEGAMKLERRWAIPHDAIYMKED